MADLTCPKCKKNELARCQCGKKYVCPVCDEGQCPACPPAVRPLATGEWLLVRVELNAPLEKLRLAWGKGAPQPALHGQLIQLPPDGSTLLFSWLKAAVEAEPEDDEAADDPTPSSKGKLSKKDLKAQKAAQKLEQAKQEKAALSKDPGEERGRDQGMVICEDAYAALIDQLKRAKAPVSTDKKSSSDDNKGDRKDDAAPTREDSCTYPVMDMNTGEPCGVTLVLVKPLTIVALMADYCLVRDDPWKQRLGAVEEEEPEVRGTITASRGSQKKEGSKGSSSARPLIERWLVHAGRMSGDLWHIIGALHFDPWLKLVIVWGTGDKDEERTRALQELIGLLQLPNECFSERHGAPVDNEVACAVGAVAVGKKAAKVERTLCGHTWASTSLIAQQVVQSKQKTYQAFVDLFDPKRIPREALGLFMQYTVEPALAQLKGGGRYLFVNMRWVGGSGQNPQHNITPLVFQQIADVVAILNKASGSGPKSPPPIQIVRVGQPELVKKFKADFEWLGPYLKTTLAVDLYHDAMVSPELFDAMLQIKLLQPHFWRCLRMHAMEHNIRVDFFGGRSGGMDIATFLGARTASWDIVDETDFNYMRLHMLAPLNSVISFTLRDGIDQGGLSLWLQGSNIVPLLARGGPLETVGSAVAYSSDKSKLDALLYPPSG